MSRHPQDTSAPRAIREHALVHDALFTELYGLLQDLNDRSLTRRDIAATLDSTVSLVRDCDDVNCLSMLTARRRIGARWAVPKYAPGADPRDGFTLTEEQVAEWQTKK